MKKWLRSSISLLLAILMVAGSIPPVRAEAADGGVDITQGLLAHYDFESVEGTAVPNLVTSNEIATAALNGSVSVADTDHMGKAMDLSGGGLQLTNIVNAAESSFSVSLWYKADGPSSGNTNIVQAGTIDGSTGRTVLILTQDSKYFTYLTADNARVTTSESVTRTDWQHITFSYDAETSKAYFFVNGTADNESGVTLSGTPASVSDMIIGRHRTSSDPFTGLIDEVRVYDKALSAEEAAAVYAYDPAQVSVPEEGLLAHYTFESGDAANSVTSNETATAALSGNASVVDLENVTVPGKAMRLSGGGLQLTNIVNAAESSFSVSLWYKADGPSSGNTNIVQAGTIGGDSGRTILILTQDSKYFTYLTADNARVTTVNPVTRTDWQHITFSYDKDTNKAWFFVNGVADNAEGLTLSGTPASVSDMIIGRHRTDADSFAGLIDEVRVYDKVLTAEEAKAIYDGTQANYTAPPAPPVDTVTLTVDVNDAQRIIDSGSIFGINHRYAFNGYGSFDSETMQIKDDFLALYEQAGFGSIRYPGGTISNLFNWKTTIGPVEERKDQIHGFYNNAGQGGIAPNFGLTEIGTFAEQVDSEIVYVYSLGRGNAQDAADLIEYLNAQVGTNPNGGIDWAAVRAANGHEAPYNVRYFEIGNEMQQAWAGSDGTASQGYWTTAVSAGAETAYIDGGTAVFTQQYAVCEEDWNAEASKSTGEPNMVRYMRYANVNPRMYDGDGNVVNDPSFRAVNDDVSVYVGGTQWTVVESFDASTATDNHVVIDYSIGAICFGDGQKGAIPAAGQQITVSYSVDREGFIDVSKAIKETTAKINEIEGTSHEAQVYSSFETAGFISKMDARDANEWYDGLTIHPYSGDPGGSGDSFYDSAMRLAENVGIAKVQEYVDMMPADKVPVISEYGIFRSTNELVRSQTHAIYIAKVLMEYVRLGSPYIQKHCLIDWYSSGADSLGPTQQAVIQAVAGSDANTVTGEGTFTFFSTPSAHVFQMLNSGFGDTVVATEFDSTPTMSNGAQCLSALAATDEDSNIYVAVVNASREADYPLELALEGISADGAAVTAQVLTADSYAAQNSPEAPEAVAVTEQTVTVEDGAITYTIPKHTFVILKIDPATELDTAAAVSGFTADRTEFPTRGGDVTVTVSGRNLPDGILVKCGDQTATTTGNAISQSATLTLPENTTGEDAVYNIQYSLDGETFVGDLSVTVCANSYDPDDDSRDIPLELLTATAGDSQSGEGPARVLDRDTSTLWHTNWYGTSRDNHWIQFELSEDYIVDGLRYQPRQNGTNGNITQYEIQVSSDGQSFETVAGGTWENNAAWKNAQFDGVEAKYVRLVALNAATDSSYVFASAAEIRLTGTKAPGHTPGEAVTENEVAPTCTESGSYDTVIYCTECGGEVSRVTTVIPATGHSHENGVCTVCGDTQGAAYNVTTQTAYASVAEALEAARSGETVLVLADQTVEAVMVTPGVTLDLNGHSVTTTYAVGFASAQIVDNAGSGRLVAAKDNVVLDKNNGMVPIYDGNGYLFTKSGFAVKKDTSYQGEGFKVNASVCPSSMDVVELLKNGAADNNLQVMILLTWDTADGTGSQKFVFTDEVVAQVFQSNNGTTTGYGKMFAMTITGADTVENLHADIALVSGTNVQYVSINGIDVK